MPSDKVILLATTTTTAGTYYEATVPDGIGGYVSRKLTFEQLRDAINAADTANKKYFVNEAALVAAYPQGENGWYAINGDTNTVWIWDGDTSAWIDTFKTSVVLSVNGQTGDVTIAANDVDFSSSVGLSANKVGYAIDELKEYVDAQIAGYAGGQYITETRSNTITAVGGEETFAFVNASSVAIPFIDDQYTYVVIDKLGIGFDYVSHTNTGFTINAYGAGQFEYQAVRISTSDGTIGGGDMLISTYDPTGVSGDAFDMDNMVEGSDTKILTADERIKLNDIEAEAEVNNISDVDAADLTDLGSTNLHKHDHDNMDGIDVAGTGVTYGHVTNLAQSFDGDKVFNNELAVTERSKAGINSITYSATISVDFSLGDVHTVSSVTGNLTVNTANVANGQTGAITFTIDSTGGYTIASGTGTWVKYDDSAYDFADCNVLSTEYHIFYIILSSKIYYSIQAVSP